jgi:hypothetical protein
MSKLEKPIIRRVKGEFFGRKDWFTLKFSSRKNLIWITPEEVIALKTELSKFES